jgi:hypothetical protein
MCRIQAIGNLERKVEDLVRAERLALDVILESLAFEEFHQLPT